MHRSVLREMASTRAFEAGDSSGSPGESSGSSGEDEQVPSSGGERESIKARGRNRVEKSVTCFELHTDTLKSGFKVSKHGKRTRVGTVASISRMLQPNMVNSICRLVIEPEGASRWRSN